MRPDGNQFPVLAIDTSARLAGAAVAAEGGEILAEVTVDRPRRGGEAVAGCVRSALEQAGCDIDSVGTLAVVHGPGSFTGIRVGLALARGLAPTDDLPALGVDSLDLVVASADVLDRRLCAVIPAGQDRVYVAGYQRDGDSFKRTLHPTLIELAELDPILTEWGGRIVLCAERGTIELLRAAQAAKTPDHLAAVPDTRARQLARLACERISEAGPVSSILPVYLAEPAATPNQNRVAAGRSGQA